MDNETVLTSGQFDNANPLTGNESATPLTETFFTPDKPSLNEMADSAGVDAPATTTQIDAKNINQPVASPVDAPIAENDIYSDLENQIRSVSGIDTMAQDEENIDDLWSVLSSSAKDVADIQRDIGNQPREQKKLEAKTGLPEFRESQRDVVAQMTALQAQLTTDLETITEQSRQEGGLAFASGGERGRRARQAAAEMAGLSAINQQLLGNIQTAQDYVTQSMNIKYSALQGELDAQNTLINMNKDKMTSKEAKLAEKRQTEISLLSNRLEKQMANELEARQSIITAMGNGLGSSTGSNLMSQLSKGSITPESVFATTGGYLVDPLDRAIKQLSYNTALETYNSTSEVNDDWGDLINDTASLAGSKDGRANTKKLLADAFKDQNYNRVYTLMANNVSEALTGENKSKFDAQRREYLALDKMSNSLQQYQDAGGDMNIFKGKAEEITRKLGLIGDDPRFTAFAVELTRNFQTYRQEMTGAAFTPQESREYASINPGTGKTIDLNLAIIKGARNAIENKYISTIEANISGAEKVWNIVSGSSSTSGQYINEVDSVLQSGDGLDDFLNGLELGGSTPATTNYKKESMDFNITL